MTEPDENGNYTEQEWDRLPIAQRMRLCASGEYEIYPSDMIDAATRIEQLETVLEKISRERTLWGAMRKADHALGKFDHQKMGETP
jgi:hypothetical protein